MKDARYTKDEIYQLIPAIYRQRDAEIRKEIEKKTGRAQYEGPLEALIEVIAEQVEIVQDNIESLYEDWFIETCNEWVTAYIADLLGVKGIRAVTDPIFSATSNSAAQAVAGANTFFSQRTKVANTLDYRSRKGTLEVLRRLAEDVTGWHAEAVEFFQLLCTTQDLNHLRLFNLACSSLRSSERLELIGIPPLDSYARTLDVRHIKKRRGYYNVPNIGIFTWRLQALPVINAPAFKVPAADGRKFTFSQLGYDDVPLFNRPSLMRLDSGNSRRHQDSDTNNNNNNVKSRCKSETLMIPSSHKYDHISIAELGVPAPIRRRALDKYLDAYYASKGNDNSISILVDGTLKNISDVVVCDLTNWVHVPPKGKVAVDPVLGRIAFSDQDPEPSMVYVNYYYGFSSKLGGGFYHRRHGEEPDSDFTNNIYRISKSGDIKTIQEAIDKWNVDQNQDAVFEIMDSNVYEETFALTLPERITLQIRAAQEQRPVIRPSGSITVNGLPNSRLILDGLLVDRANVGQSNLLSIEPGDLAVLEIMHCTLTPDRQSDSSSPSTSISLAVSGIPQSNQGGRNDNLSVFIDYSICGRIKISDSEAKIKISNSVIDGKGTLSAVSCREALIESSTVFGKVTVTIIDLASNSIFTDLLIAQRRQQGCVRFSYIPPGSITPPRHKCQPEEESITFPSSISYPRRIRPRFTSERYGDPGYAQLHRDIAQNAYLGTEKIFEGADNAAEMGVFNHLYQPQRIRDLMFSLDEYLRSGMEVGIFLAT